MGGGLGFNRIVFKAEVDDNDGLGTKILIRAFVCNGEENQESDDYFRESIEYLLHPFDQHDYHEDLQMFAMSLIDKINSGMCQEFLERYDWL